MLPAGNGRLSVGVHGPVAVVAKLAGRRARGEGDCGRSRRAVGKAECLQLHCQRAGGAPRGGGDRRRSRRRAGSATSWRRPATALRTSHRREWFVHQSGAQAAEPGSGSGAPESGIAVAMRSRIAAVSAPNSPGVSPSEFRGDQAKPMRSTVGAGRGCERAVGVDLAGDEVLHLLDRRGRPAVRRRATPRQRCRTERRSARAVPGAAAVSGPALASAGSWVRYCAIASRRWSAVVPATA